MEKIKLKKVKIDLAGPLRVKVRLPFQCARAGFDACCCHSPSKDTASILLARLDVEAV